MPKLRIHAYSMSLDGYVAGPDQTVDNPLGVGGERLHEWIFETRGGRKMIGESGGRGGVDDDFFHHGFEGIGATVMGRNMFGPIRGSWDSPEARAWRGWWGDDPPYHHPVFVLTHHEHERIEMRGGTTFHFVTDGIESALARAFEAADGADVRLGGGAATVREYLRAGLVDYAHFPMAPVLLCEGERLFEDDLGHALDRYEVAEVVPGEGATHVVLRRRP